MLKENKSLKNEIVSFKLGSGEEIIAKVKEHNDDTFELNKAVVLATAPDGGMRLIPWLMSTNNDDILLNKTNVLGYALTSSDIADQYTQSVSSIQIVK